MHTLIRQLFSSAALVAAVFLPQAQAQTQVLDFEGGDLAGLYDPAEPVFPTTFSQKGFTMTPRFDFGIVDSNDGLGLGSVTPTGNLTQYYFSSNDSDLLITRTDGGTFSLDGFSVAFVPLLPSPPQTIVIVAVGIPAVGDPFGTFFGLGSSATNSYPFITYAGAADFGQFTNLVAVDFFACVLTSTSVCDVASRNNGQFALDNVIVTTPVPEPSTYALMALGLAGLAVLRNRRKTLGSR